MRPAPPSGALLLRVISGRDTDWSRSSWPFCSSIASSRGSSACPFSVLDRRVGAADAGVSLDHRPLGAALVSGHRRALDRRRHRFRDDRVCAARRAPHQDGPEQYIVGGRSFGTLFLWVLLAGEIYTTFTFLGIAGLSYSQGAPAYYIMAYGTAAYIIAYFLAPADLASRQGTQLAHRRRTFSRFATAAARLGVGVACLQFVMVVPYVTLQLSGLQILLRIAGYGTYNATVR